MEKVDHRLSELKNDMYEFALELYRLAVLDGTDKEARDGVLALIAFAADMTKDLKDYELL